MDFKEALIDNVHEEIELPILAKEIVSKEIQRKNSHWILNYLYSFIFVVIQNLTIKNLWIIVQLIQKSNIKVKSLVKQMFGFTKFVTILFNC